jgi:hypothetical protein
MYQPYGGYGYPPPTSQPIVFIPSPGATPPPGFDIDGITRQIAGLEALKKLMKEDKKDGPDKKKPEQPNIVSMMLLMILMSPITGPIMSKFFSLGLSYLPH